MCISIWPSHCPIRDAAVTTSVALRRPFTCATSFGGTFKFFRICGVSSIIRNISSFCLATGVFGDPDFKSSISGSSLPSSLLKPFETSSLLKPFESSSLLMPFESSNVVGEVSRRFLGSGLTLDLLPRFRPFLQSEMSFLKRKLASYNSVQNILSVRKREVEVSVLLLLFLN